MRPDIKARSMAKTEADIKARSTTKMRKEMGTKKKALGIYVHIPFCVQKCLYCDFLSSPASADTIEHYVNLILREMQAAAELGQLQDYEAATIFMGGGTPSLLTVRQIESILCKLKDVLPLYADAEISMEMNPGTVTREKLADIRSVGVNRISIGVQSFQEDELAALGRIHRAEEVHRLWKWTEQLGYQNRNLDLMSGIPGQTEQSFQDTLKQAVLLAPEHLSVYSLIVEEGTPFETMYPNGAVDEETDRRLYVLTKAFLHAHGYERYEISNYAKSGYACRHNLIYWKREDYLGFGLGAASFVNGVRFQNAGDMAEYGRNIAQREACAAGKARQRESGFAAEERCEKSGFAAGERHGEARDKEPENRCRGDVVPAYAEWEPLSEADSMAETMFLGLRLIRGVSEREFEERFGRRIQEVYGDVLQKHIQNGLLVQENGFYFLTERGLDVSNYVMADFLL